MKKITTTLTLFMIILITFSFNACSEKEVPEPEVPADHSGKLQRIEYGFMTDYFYDFNYQDDGRLKSMAINIIGEKIIFTLSYQNGKVAKMVAPQYDYSIELKYSGDTITLIDAENPGVPFVKCLATGDKINSVSMFTEEGIIDEELRMTYTGDNATQVDMIEFDGEGTALNLIKLYEFAYSNTTSPMNFSSDVQACLIPIFYDEPAFFQLLSKQNFNSITSIHETLPVVYTYNADGLPTDMTFDDELFYNFYYY